MFAFWEFKFHQPKFGLKETLEKNEQATACTSMDLVHI